MRILHVLNHARRTHGNVHVAVDLACEQARCGHVVGYASEGGNLAPIMEQHGVRLFHLDQTRNRLVRLPEITLGLAAIIRKFRPDVVHAHMMTAALTGYFATRVTGAPLVTHIHNSFDRHSTLMRLGDRIIAVGDAVARQAIARGMKADRVRTVINGTEGSARLSQAPPPPADLQHPNVTTVCGIHPRKGVDVLVRAFEIVHASRPDAHLYVVGNGPNFEEYKALAAAGPASAVVHFLGQIEDPRGILAASDIFCLASLADPFPLSICEARWAGCAVVGTDVDGIPEALDYGRAGKLAPAGDARALAVELLAMLQPETLKAGRQAALLGVERFTVERVAQDVEAVYRELVGVP
jgi:glycosyltransferase involved in cell wall biosynthesis